jgi:hypothetical protein
VAGSNQQVTIILAPALRNLRMNSAMAPSRPVMGTDLSKRSNVSMTGGPCQGPGGGFFYVGRCTNIPTDGMFFHQWTGSIRAVSQATVIKSSKGCIRNMLARYCHASGGSAIFP